MIRDKKQTKIVFICLLNQRHTLERKKIKFPIAKDFKHLVSTTLKEQFKKFSCALP